MNRYQYLQRLNYTGTLQPNLTTLKALQEAHLLTIPFENLSIHAQQPIQLDEASLFQKSSSTVEAGFAMNSTAFLQHCSETWVSR